MSTPRVALVTGASGFIGRALCSELKLQGVTVWATARRPARGPWDRFGTSELARSGLPPGCLENVDTVFHLAGKAHNENSDPDDEEHWAVTVEGTRRVLEASKRASIRHFIYMSSVKAAGDGGDTLVDEDFDRAPSNAYGRAKREAERLVLRLGADSGMHAAVLRPSLVYGPGWKGNLARMFRAVQARRFPPVPDTQNRRSMIHVTDVVVAAVLAARCTQTAGRVYILCDGEAYSTRRVYEAMCRTLGRSAAIHPLPFGLWRCAARAGDLIGRHTPCRVPFDSVILDRLFGSAWYDSTRARRELQWRPLRTFEESLSEIAWPRES